VIFKTGMFSYIPCSCTRRAGWCQQFQFHSSLRVSQSLTFTECLYWNVITPKSGLCIQGSSNWDKATEGCVVLSNLFLSQILRQDFPEIRKPNTSPEDAHWRAAL